MASWEGETTNDGSGEGKFDIRTRFKPTLVARAEKRTAVKMGDGRWEVRGNTKLGDSYEDYTITRKAGQTNYHCSCQDHAGGEYRRVCSHILRVILGEHGWMEWDGEGGDQDDDEPVQGVATWVEPAPAVFISAPDPLPLDWTPRGLDEYDFEPGPLPAWVEGIREHQVPAVDEIVRLFEEEKKKVVFLDAPTGSGKTLIGELARRKLMPRRAVYTCTTKSLQEQVLADFPYAKIIKGRANYQTADQPRQFPHVACDLCDETMVEFPGCDKCVRHFGDPDRGGQYEVGEEFRHCPECHPWRGSHYIKAREAASTAHLAVANTAYLLRETSGQLDKSNFARAELYIMDEADQLESELMGMIEVVIGKRMLAKIGIDIPKKVSVADNWVEWCIEEAIPALTRYADSFPPVRKRTPSERRERKRVGDLTSRLAWLVDSREEGDPPRLSTGFVMDGYKAGHVIFKPVKIDEFAQNALWRIGERFLLMSASFISPVQEAANLGLEDDEWGLVTVPSTFDADRRPIYIDMVAPVTAKSMDVAVPKLVNFLRKIIARHNERILVHTVSYKLAGSLMAGLRASFLKSSPKGTARQSRLLTYANARERDAILAKFLASDNGVLFAPSFDRGIDLAGDKCRVSVITKVPYPNLGDKQVAKRLYTRGGKDWYAMQTVRTLVQMSGRAMRSADDHAETYVLDSKFIDMWKEHKRMFPKWWRDAVEMGGSKRKYGS